jgi:ubiquinone/menaquinone biosynthesis C-methylase UbiE
MLAGAAGFRPGMRVLELGCGTGTFTRQWAATGIRLMAVDISQDLLRRGAADGGAESARGAVMDVEALAVGGARFDAVVGVSVLHHVDLSRTLAETRRVLRPGGRIAFSEPNRLNPQVAIQENIPFLRRRMGYTPYETSFTRWTLGLALRRHGFSDVRIDPFDFLHPWTPRRAIPLVSRLAAAAERIPLLKQIAGSLFITAARS